MTQFKRHRIRLVFPEGGVQRTGNRCTASQWAAIFAELGHLVLAEDQAGETSDVVVAVHAARSHDKIVQYHSDHPSGKIVVALAGSDIYPTPDDKTLASIAAADRVVALQRNAIDQIPPAQHGKVRVILQSARPSGTKSENASDDFPICVVGHLRDIKDPLRSAAAARLLPASSQISIYHAGGILEPHYHDLVAREMEENPRYHWLGEQTEQEVADLIASSRLMVLSSQFEGGARVLGEALVHSTPVISSRIEGVVGLVGDDYPGFFPLGDTEALADLLRRAETDSDYFQELKDAASDLAPQFHPDRERDAWRDLLDEFDL